LERPLEPPRLEHPLPARLRKLPSRLPARDRALGVTGQPGEETARHAERGANVADEIAGTLRGRRGRLGGMAPHPGCRAGSGGASLRMSSHDPTIRERTVAVKQFYTQ